MQFSPIQREARFSSWPWAVVFFAAAIGLGALNYALLVPVRQATIDAEIVELRQVADLMNGSVSALLRRVEGTLDGVEQTRQMDTFGVNLDAYLQVESSSIEAISAITIRDARGRALASSSRLPNEIDDGAPAFFARLHAEGAASGAAQNGDRRPLYFSRPMRRFADATWQIWMSIAEVDASGEPLFIISAAIDTRQIADRLMPVADGYDDANALVDRNMLLVARAPWVDDRIGTSVAASPLYEALNSSTELSAAAEYQSSFNDSERLGVARWIFHRHFLVGVSRPLETVLAGWWLSVLIAVIGSLVVLPLISLMWWITVRDTAKQRASNKAMRDSERKYRLLIDGVSDYAIYMLDPEGRVANWSQGAERIKGYSAEEVLGEHISIFYTDAERRSHEAAHNLEQAKILGRYESEGWRVRKDGKRFWANTIIQAVRGENGELLGFAKIARDTTERKKILNELRFAKAKAERAAAAKSDFLANMSHEIRTPLTGILGYSRLALEHGHMSKTVRSYIERVFDASSALRVIIDDILDFSKLEAGELRFEETPFRVRDFVESCVSIVRLMAEDKGLKLVSKIDDDVPAWVTGDPSRLRQVLLNLLNNAIKFTPQGRVEVKLSCVSTTGKDARLRLAVVDTGIGIADADQRKLFIRFSQADSSIARKHGGTGLGLAISKRIIEAMGGEIGLDSKPGVGSTFWFAVTLPLADAPAVKDDKAGAGAKRRLDILVTDDLEMNRELVKLLLEYAGHRVSLARDGAQAIELAKANHYDLILMDIQMPGVDGIEAAQRIRKLPPGHGDMPIVALTADVAPGRLARYEQAGFTEHITKPIDTDALLRFMDRFAMRLEEEGRTAHSDVDDHVSV